MKTSPKKYILTFLLSAAALFTAHAQIYVTSADGGSNKVAAYNLDGSVNGVFTSILGGDPYGLALDGAGNLYVGNLAGPNIGKYNATTGAVIAAPLGSAGQPFGLAVSGNTIYDAAFGNNRVSTYDATTGAALNLGFIPGIGQAAGVVLDGNGNLYVASYASGTVGKYNATTGASINPTFITGFTHASGLAIDSFGNLYVSSDNTGTIGKYDITLQSFNPSFATSGAVYSLAVDSFDYLYSANYSSGTVSKYDSTNGTLLNGSLINIGGHPVGIAIAPTAIPEPSSLALLCIGSAAFVFWRMRRTLRASS